MQTSIMATSDQLLDEIYSWIRQRECCADKLRELARELESITKNCRAVQTAGSSVSVIGSVCLLGASVATLFTGGAAAPILGAVGAVYTGVGVGTSVISKITEGFLSSKTMEEALKKDQQSNKTVETIQQLFKRLAVEMKRVNPSADPEELDLLVMTEYLNAMARRSGLGYRIHISLGNDEPFIFLNEGRGGPGEMRRNLRINPALHAGVFSALAIFAVQMSGKEFIYLGGAATKIISQKGFEIALKETSKAGLKKAAVGGAMVAVGAVALAFSLSEAVDDWEKMIKDNHVTEASQSLRDTANNIQETTQEQRNKLDNIKKMLDEMAKEQQTHEKAQREREIQQQQERVIQQQREREIQQQREREKIQQQREHKQRELEKIQQQREREIQQQREREKIQQQREREKIQQQRQREKTQREREFELVMIQRLRELEKKPPRVKNNQQNHDKDHGRFLSSTPAQEDKGNQDHDAKPQQTNQTDENRRSQKEKKRDQSEQSGGGQQEGGGQQGGGDQGDQGRDSKDEERDQTDEERDSEDEESSEETKQTSTEDVRAALLNLRSMNNKTTQISNLITRTERDVFLTTETWLRRDTGDAVLRRGTPEGFSAYHWMRDSRGGGVAIQHTEELQGEQTRFTEPTTFEYVAILLNRRGWDEPILVISLYHRHPTNLRQFENFLDELQNLLNDQPYTRVILAGDFNIWLDVERNRFTKRFMEFLNTNALDRHVWEATYRSGHFLDQVFSSNVDVFDVFVRNDEISDHFTVYFTIRLVSKDKKKKTKADVDQDEREKRFRKREQ